MKWINWSERPPEKQTDTTKNSVSVKVYNRKDAVYWDGDNWLWIGTSDKVSDTDFSVLMWLDEFVSEEQDELWNELSETWEDLTDHDMQKRHHSFNILKSKFSLIKK